MALVYVTGAMGFFSRTFGRKDAEQSQTSTTPALDSGAAPPPAPDMTGGESFSIPAVRYLPRDRLPNAGKAEPMQYLTETGHFVHSSETHRANSYVCRANLWHVPLVSTALDGSIFSYPGC